MSNLKRIAIIGGGLSGLAAAQRLVELSTPDTPPLEIQLFEASDRLGGVFGTVYQDGYRIESGADMFITNNPTCLNLVKKLGLQDHLIETNAEYRRSFILKNGRPLTTPAGFDLMTPRNFAAFLKSPLLSISGKLRAMKEYWIPANCQPDESLKSFAVRRFGQEAYERMIQPMIGGIYTADPEKLSLRSTLPRFMEMEEKYGSLLKGVLAEKKKKAQASEEEKASGARYSLFLSLDEGMSLLHEALINAISEKVSIHKNSPIRSMTESSGTYLVTPENSEPIKFDAVILALPADRASRLTTEVDQELSTELGSIPYASAAIVVTGYKLSQSKHPLDCFGLVIPAVENRQILAVSCTSRKFPGRAPEGSIQLRTFIGGALQQELLKNDDETLTQIVRSELKDIFGIEGDPETVRVVRWERAMPQYHVGHQQHVQKIAELAASHPGLSIAGNGLNGVGIPDVIQAAQKAAENCLRSL